MILIVFPNYFSVHLATDDTITSNMKMEKYWENLQVALGEQQRLTLGGDTSSGIAATVSVSVMSKEKNLTDISIYEKPFQMLPITSKNTFTEYNVKFG